MNTLLVVSADALEYAALFTAADLRKLEIHIASDPVTALSLAPVCNIILGDPTRVSGLLASADRLEWVQSSWAGVDSLCRTGMRRDYVLTGLKGIFGPLISEYVFTYLFALERRLFTMYNNQSTGNWQPFSYRSAREITLGIAGLGSIGKHLARTARHFGLRVVGLNRSGKPCEDVDKVYTAEDSGDFFERSDYLVLTLPETPQTRNFINAEVLDRMKRSSVLMNVGRGATVNESDLLKALQHGEIAGAVLDVFVNEPLPQNSPFWHQPNVYITPHTAATSVPADVFAVFSENYRRFLQRKPLRNVVNFELGY